MRKTRLGFIAVAVAAVAAASVPSFAGTGGHATTAVKRIRASNYYFCSWSKTSCSSTDSGHVARVLVGTKVKWIYTDTTGCDTQPLCPGHDVAFSASNVSPTVKTDGALIRAFTYNSVGKFHFWCSHHSTDATHTTGMYGYIRVHS
jgi:hypothetical protein